ncbi:MAG: TonB-dependent receptor [Melioribacteraceae bacterium]
MAKWKRFQPHLMLISLLSIFFLHNVVLAGTSGKIAGKIKDAETGELLIGANVMVLESQIGAASDVEGDYYIINVPPGVYRLKVSMIGYSDKIITNVVVNSDRTTTLNIELVPTTISTEEVVIVAEKPVIRQDLTASIVEVGAKEIELMTHQDVQTMLKQQRGVIISQKQLGKAGNFYFNTPSDGLHIRGGRENETAFTIDGMVVTDPTWGGSEFIQNSSGDYIDEFSTLAGTFNAEYGNAMSGVINVVTKDGSNQEFHGSIKTYTDGFGVDEYNNKTLQGTFNLGGPIPFTDKTLTFLLYGERKVSDGYLYGYQYPNWSDSRGLDIDSITKLPAGDGKKVSMDQSDYTNTSAKLTWSPSSTIRVSAFGGYSELKRDYYDHGFQYYQAGMPHHESEELFINLNWTHTISTNTYYIVGLGSQTHDRFLGTFRDLAKYDLNTERSDPNQFSYSGENWMHQTEKSRTNTLRAALVSQVNKNNLIKFGGHFRGINIKLFDLSPSGAPYTIYQNYDYKPVEFAAYLQDKMEFSSIGLIINVGVRFDYWNVKAPYNANTIDLNANDWKDSEAKSALSPRFGISYPVSDVAAFHFAYGHFYQMTAYNLLYQGHRYLTDESDANWLNFPDRHGKIYRGITEEWHFFLPNTNMDPEKTVAYEAGVQIKLSDDVALDVSAFYRDMSSLVGSRFSADGNNGNGLVLADNYDYGNSKGIEFSINKRFSNYFAFNLNYTFTNSVITSSTPWTKLQIENPTYRTYTSDWDKPHTINFDLYITLPDKWDITFAGNYSTGLPYTLATSTEVPNTERSPYFAQFDLRLAKTFEVWGVHPQIYLNVINLFDRKSIYSVYPTSGQPDLPLNVARTPLNLSRYNDPSNYGPGRMVYLGASFGF